MSENEPHEKDSLFTPQTEYPHVTPLDNDSSTVVRDYIEDAAPHAPAPTKATFQTAAFNKVETDNTIGQDSTSPNVERTGSQTPDSLFTPATPPQVDQATEHVVDTIMPRVVEPSKNTKGFAATEFPNATPPAEPKKGGPKM